MRGKLGQYCLEIMVEYKSRLCRKPPERACRQMALLILALSKVKGKYSGLARTGHSLEVSRLDTEIHLPSCRWILINNLM